MTFKSLLQALFAMMLVLLLISGCSAPAAATEPPATSMLPTVPSVPPTAANMPPPPTFEPMITPTPGPTATLAPTPTAPVSTGPWQTTVKETVLGEMKLHSAFEISQNAYAPAAGSAAVRVRVAFRYLGDYPPFPTPGAMFNGIGLYESAKGDEPPASAQRAAVALRDIVLVGEDGKTYPVMGFGTAASGPGDLIDALIGPNMSGFTLLSPKAEMTYDFIFAVPQEVLNHNLEWQYRPAHADTASPPGVASLDHSVTDGEARPPTGILRRYVNTGSGELTVINGAESDGLIVLAQLDRRPVVAAYVRAGEEILIDRIPDGEYQLFFSKGRAWDAERRQFMQDASTQRLADTLQFTTSSTQASSWEVTLYAVADGNADTKMVDPSAFPSLD